MTSAARDRRPRDVIRVLGGVALLAASIVIGDLLPEFLRGWVIVFAIAATIATGLLVVLGSRDRRPGPAEVAAALQAGGFAVTSAVPAPVPGKGSRPFVATTEQGDRYFVKVLGRDQRDADLLYRMYRSIRLSGVGDVRPAASLKQAVEHQALVGMMAERVGVRAPRVHRVIEGSADRPDR